MAPEHYMTKKNLKLNIGGGFSRLRGFANVDCRRVTKPEYIADLEKKDSLKAIKDNTVCEVVMSHVLEHIKNIEFLMAEIYRVCANGAKVNIIVPYWTHQTAVEDPTHVRFFTENSMMYFSKKTTGSDGHQITIPYDFDLVSVSAMAEPEFARLSPSELVFKAKERFNVIRQISFVLKVIKKK